MYQKPIPIYALLAVARILVKPMVQFSTRSLPQLQEQLKGPWRFPQRILMIGSEQKHEFDAAAQQIQRGHRVTVVNPIVTIAAQGYSARGGDFRPIRLETLPLHRRYHLICENYPYPLGRTLQAIDFARQRLTRLLPGGRWVVVTEHREFADTLYDIAKTLGFSAGLTRLLLHRAPPASPRYIHPQIKDRYRLEVRSG